MSPGYVLERATGRKGDARAETRLTFKPVGESVALLFLRDPETAREVNDATSLIRHNINGVLANRLVMRIGNCIARATFNENENAVMLDLTATVGMRRCQRMLSALLARRVQEGEGEDDDISQAKPLRPSGGAAGRTRAARLPESPRRGPGAARARGAATTRTRWTGRRRRRRWGARAEVTEEEKGRARGLSPPAICAAKAPATVTRCSVERATLKRREEAKDEKGTAFPRKARSGSARARPRCITGCRRSVLENAADG